MNEWFIFAASFVCLAVGMVLCSLPANRYFRSANVGFAGFFILVLGVVLMTTFKWTEVAIKFSGLEVRLAEAERQVTEARTSLAAVQEAITPEAKTQALEAVLAKYKQVSNTVPSEEQVTDFTTALGAANVTVVPLEAFTAVGGLSKPAD